MDLPEKIEIVDVGPRDGLQNEDRSLPSNTRTELCDRLAAASLPRIEAASFVNPSEFRRWPVQKKCWQG